MSTADSGSEHTDSDYEYEENSDSESEVNSEVESEDEEEIKKFANMINSNHKSVQFEGLVGIRMLLSIVDFPPIQEVIDSRILPKILEIMTWEHESQFQVESSWCILNISAGEAEFTDHLIELGALDIIINLLDSPLNAIVGHAVWTINNITTTSMRHRDLCLQKDCLNKLIQTLEKFPTSGVIIENGLNAIGELTKGKPFPPGEIVLPALPLLYKHISEVFSQEALRMALWSLSYIGGIFFELCEHLFKNELDEKTQEVIDQGCVPFFIQHFCQGSQEIVAPTFRAVANLLAGDDKQANEILSYPEFLPRLFEMTSHAKMVFRKEAFWAISNITAGTSEQIEMIIKNEIFMKRLKDAVVSEPTEVAREAAWALTNMFSAATDEQTHRVIYDRGMTHSFYHILKDFEDDLKQNALEAILNILKTKADNVTKDSWMEAIKKEAGLVEMIQDLAKDGEFSSNAELILNYFSVKNLEESN